MTNRKRLLALAIFAGVAAWGCSSTADSKSRQSPVLGGALRVAVIGNDAELVSALSGGLGKQPLYSAVSLAGDFQQIASRGMADKAALLGAVGGSKAEVVLVVHREGNKNSVRLYDGKSGEQAAAWSASGPKDPAAVRQAVDSILEARAVVKSLQNAPKDTKNIKVSVSFEKDRYRVGDSLAFTVTSEADGHIIILYVQPDGTFVPLTPNKLGLPTEIKAGQALRFPSRGTSKIKVTPPAGIEFVYALVSKQPVSLPADTLDGAGLYAKFSLGRGPEAVRAFAAGLKKLPPESFGTAHAAFLSYE